MTTPTLYFGDQAARESAYSARNSVPDFDAEMRRYATRSAAVRRKREFHADLRYGPAPAQRLDLFPVMGASEPTPLLVFIHGGFWRSQRKEDNCLVAEYLPDEEIAVAVIEYTLAPKAALPDIVEETRAAVSMLYREATQYGIDPTRIVLGGSSAGAHLAAMMLGSDWQAHHALPADVIKGVVALSGLFELDPLRGLVVDTDLRLTAEVVASCSPARQTPGDRTQIVLALGDREPDGFAAQTTYFAQWLRIHGIEPTIVYGVGRNHFDLLLMLTESDTELARSVVALCRSETLPHLAI